MNPSFYACFAAFVVIVREGGEAATHYINVGATIGQDTYVGITSAGRARNRPIDYADDGRVAAARTEVSAAAPETDTIVRFLGRGSPAGGGRRPGRGPPRPGLTTSSPLGPPTRRLP